MKKEMEDICKQYMKKHPGLARDAGEMKAILQLTFMPFTFYFMRSHYSSMMPEHLKEIDKKIQSGEYKKEFNLEG